MMVDWVMGFRRGQTIIRRWVDEHGNMHESIIEPHEFYKTPLNQHPADTHGEYLDYLDSARDKRFE